MKIEQIEKQEIEIYSLLFSNDQTPKADAMVRAMDSGDLQYLKELLHA